MDKPLRVLIIEDSEDDARLILRDLERSGYDPISKRVETPEAMGSALKEETWDIIISDYTMPHFNGLEALRLLGSSGLDIPCIIVSGKIGEDTAVQLMKAGANDYVMKGKLKRLAPAIERELNDAEGRRERKRAEAMLRSEQIMLARTEGIAHVGSWKWDIASDTVTWSDELFRIFQRDPQEGAPSFAEHPALYLPEDMARLRQAVEAAVADGTPYELDLRAIRKDGEIRSCLARGVAEMAMGGRAVRLCGSLQDITERKKMQEQLMAQDRLASIGELVAGVAHEINNPLTGIIGFSELLLKRDLPGDVKEDLKMINDEAMRTAKIVKNLLAFARKQPEGKVPVDLNENIQRVLQLRDHEQKVNNIEVIAHLASDLPQVMGNSSQLQQVIFNMVINAEFFMLKAHNKGNLTITTEKAGDFVRASITDDGPGISKEHMKNLFTPFFTTKEVGKGTGLGLSICYGIITKHGGRIYALSEPGNGATFIVELPIKEEAE